VWWQQRKPNREEREERQRQTAGNAAAHPAAAERKRAANAAENKPARHKPEAAANAVVMNQPEIKPGGICVVQNNEPRWWYRKNVHSRQGSGRHSRLKGRTQCRRYAR